MKKTKVTMEIDYKKLLKKYIKHVADCEGTTFIEDNLIRDTFTKEEIQILTGIKWGLM